MPEPVTQPDAPLHEPTHQPIERVVLANPRADVSPEHLATVVEEGRRLITAIPGVELLSWGLAIQADAPDRCYLRMRFRDAAALQVYETHPNHTNFGQQQWLPIIAELLIVDYQMQY